MAIFGFKNKEKKEEIKKEAAPKAVRAKKAVAKKVIAPVSSAITVSNRTSLRADAIIRPRVTEKSGILSQGGVYTFEVKKTANKNTVAEAVRSIYKVIPVKVAIVNQPAKNVFVKGKWGTVDGIKKAVVTLKKGDKIDFV